MFTFIFDILHYYIKIFVKYSPLDVGASVRLRSGIISIANVASCRDIN